MEKILCDAIGRGLPLKYACSLARIAYSTFADWRTSSPEFAEAIERAQAESISRCLEIIAAAAPKNWAAAGWYLERCFPESFGRNRLEIQHVGAVAIEHSYVVPKEVLDQIAQARTQLDEQRKGQ
jgi:hypothetical protein